MANIINLVDVTNIKIDENLNKQERMEQFLEQNKGNPYDFKIGNIAVKLGFVNTSVTLDERVQEYLSSL